MVTLTACAVAEGTDDGTTADDVPVVSLDVPADASTDAVSDAVSDAVPDAESDAVSDAVPDSLSDGVSDIVVAIDIIDVVLPPGCCLKDGDCTAEGGQILTCAFRAFADPGEAGACKPLPEAGRCWDDGDCAAGQGCKGASFCPCNLACGMAEALGTCKQFAGPGESCGAEGSICRPGLACCYPCGIPGCDWECTEPCDAGQGGCVDGCMMYP